MTNNSNQKIWDEISHHQKELSILYFKLRQLSINEQIDTLKYAFSIDDEANVWKYLLVVEPVDYRKSDRELSKGLFDIILEASVYPGDFELDAQVLLKALIIDFPDYIELIHTGILEHLAEADKTSDYEVYQRTCDLLIDIKSNHLNEFLQRCREHECSDIRDIGEDWDD